MSAVQRRRRFFLLMHFVFDSPRRRIFRSKPKVPEGKKIAKPPRGIAAITRLASVRLRHVRSYCSRVKRRKCERTGNSRDFCNRVWIRFFFFRFFRSDVRSVNVLSSSSALKNSHKTWRASPCPRRNTITRRALAVNAPKRIGVVVVCVSLRGVLFQKVFN